MKSTGMVRKSDELGRVVIPKEIRRTLGIKEGVQVEIFTNKDEIIIKKYVPTYDVKGKIEDAILSLKDLSKHKGIKSEDAQSIENYLSLALEEFEKLKL